MAQIKTIKYSSGSPFIAEQTLLYLTLLYLNNSYLHCHP